jgi:hypothetical protein
VEANSTGGQGSRRAVAPSDDGDENQYTTGKGLGFWTWPGQVEILSLLTPTARQKLKNLL